ncbi:10086_t:CDS:2 [Scutellospora calospora]|uniref:10086_t:CDS:1 n=1 Tax=Scutellospora calospora TaxID=85575 RepID=A0ACA9K3N8_9GLOM|nr:10086_t:CDS:2 [Scutellospora calospora]
MLKQEQLSELSEIQSQFFSDIDETEEFKEALNLYVKPQGTWNVSIIKSLDNEKEMVSEDKKGDVEKVVNGFLGSKDRLSSYDKEILEKAANELLNSKDKTSLINTVNGFFAQENRLTLEDEKDPNRIIIHEENVKFLELESRNYLVSKDKEKFKNAVSKLMDLKSKNFLEIAVNNILASKCKKVLLILGVGGTGKSTFNRYLARRLWNEHDQSNMTQPIPLFIALAQLKEGMLNRNQDFIEIYLKECGLSLDTIKVLRERKFVFILDGYDEISERERHCYESNKFNKWKNSKVIISCRPEYLGSGYKNKFLPKNGERGFQELTITPFSQTEIEQYIKNYTQNKGHLLDWDADTYIQQIKNIQIEKIVINPILLKITLIVLPDLVNEYVTIDRQINRIVLYEKFFETWFSRAQNRLLKIQLKDKEKEAFNNLDSEDFLKYCLKFSKDFAVKMFEDNNKVVIDYDPVSEEIKSNWSSFFSNEDTKHCLLRFSMPLIRRGNQYWFLHKTLRDYLIASVFLESCKSTLHTALFNKHLLVSEHDVRQFLVEFIQQKETYIQKLLSIINSSKNDDKVQIASANASTILIQAGVTLKNLNLTDSNISGADLSNGVFDNLQLARSKLNNVNFQNARLQNTNLQNSSLQNANFKGADLSSANLQNAILHYADFQNAKLLNANLQSTSSQNANFEDANFSSANFQNAIFNNANFQNATFNSADFQNTILNNANFQNAKLINTNLQNSFSQNANFKGADLSFANFHNAIIQDAIFHNSCLNNVNFEAAFLRSINVNLRTYLQGTNLQNFSLQYKVHVFVNLQDINLRGTSFKGLNQQIILVLRFYSLEAIRIKFDNPNPNRSRFNY